MRFSLGFQVFACIIFITSVLGFQFYSAEFRARSIAYQKRGSVVQSRRAPSTSPLTAPTSAVRTANTKISKSSEVVRMASSIDLADFPMVSTLNEPVDTNILDNKLTLLYFAAAWCPDCVRFGPTLNSFLEEISDDEIEVVLVSSDESEAAAIAHAFQLNRKLKLIQYDSPVRNNLKLQFGACAAREVSQLSGIDRKHGIPTIAVLHRTTKALITMNGADDLASKTASEVLEHWTNLSA